MGEPILFLPLTKQIAEATRLGEYPIRTTPVATPIGDFAASRQSRTLQKLEDLHRRGAASLACTGFGIIQPVICSTLDELRCFRSQSSNPKRERGRALPSSLTLRVTFKAARVQYKSANSGTRYRMIQNWLASFVLVIGLGLQEFLVA
jgi:hypothetical protein